MHRQDRPVPGEAHRPKRFPGCAFLSPAKRPGPRRQAAVQQQRRQPLEPVVFRRIQSQEVQQRPGANPGQAQRAPDLAGLPPARHPFPRGPVCFQQSHGKPHLRPFSRREVQRHAQRTHRVQRRAGPAGQGPGQGVAHARVAKSPRQLFIVAFPGERALARGQHRQPETGRAAAARPTLK